IHSGALRKALVQTLWPFSVGMALTVIVGTLLGIVIAQWRILEYILDPFINALYAIPRIALVPLIILWAGLEFTGKVTILVAVAAARTRAVLAALTTVRARPWSTHDRRACTASHDGSARCRDTGSRSARPAPTRRKRDKARRRRDCR